MKDNISRYRYKDYHERTLQCNGITLHRLDGGIRNNSLPSLQHWGDADFLPLNGNLQNFIECRL